MRHKKQARQKNRCDIKTGAAGNCNRERRQGMHELDYTKMGLRIRQFRKAKGWSQQKLAEKCGISLNFMGHIERGTRKMSMDTFVSLCKELETDADALLWGVIQPSETAIQGIWDQPRQQDSDHYEMYLRIMKSVADILNSKGR